MTSIQEEIPADIARLAFTANVNARLMSTLDQQAEAIADAIYAAVIVERKRAYEECAGIALQRTVQLANDSDMTRGYTEGRKAAAAAIRALLK